MSKIDKVISDLRLAQSFLLDGGKGEARNQAMQHIAMAQASMVEIKRGLDEFLQKNGCK